MNKGKELLIDIISSTDIKDDNQPIIINDININDLFNKIKDDKYYLGNLDDELIDEIIARNKYQRHIIFIKKLYQLRDLYKGKNEYNINIDDKPDHDKTIETFLTLLNELIYADNKLGNIEDRLNNLSSAIKYNEIIDDHELIELIVREYDKLNFDSNMLLIMEYISKHNYNILNDKSLENTMNLTNELKINDIDDDIKDILNKLNINYKELPVDYKLMIKNTSKEQIIDIYNLIKHNKVEDYGILHLIDKTNELAKLSILLFSSVETIKNVVETFRDNNDDLDIKSIKKLINIILPVMISNDNEICNPLYHNYMDNIKLFKKIDINIISLLNKCPLLFILKNEKILNVLNTFNKYKVDNKKVINKLYKTIAINPDLVINNLEILKKIINLEEYLAGTNYNLLKVVNLNDKIQYINNKYGNVDDYLNVLVKEIYDNKERYMWGDIDA